MPLVKRAELWPPPAAMAVTLVSSMTFTGMEHWAVPIAHRQHDVIRLFRRHEDTRCAGSLFYSIIPI
ncbi:MAG TPA: hypothetical protein VN666_03405 [Nitrospira sp.]|nr:hypothetical protein [Nitrospira sp.]